MATNHTKSQALKPLCVHPDGLEHPADGPDLLGRYATCDGHREPIDWPALVIVYGLAIVLSGAAGALVAALIRSTWVWGW